VLNAPVTRSTGLPLCTSVASPNAVVRPERSTDTGISAGPAVPGRRKNPDTTTGSGNGMAWPSVRTQRASM
jgi:hypothetical protein